MCFHLRHFFFCGSTSISTLFPSTTICGEKQNEENSCCSIESLPFIVLLLPLPFGFHFFFFFSLFPCLVVCSFCLLISPDTLVIFLPSHVFVTACTTGRVDTPPDCRVCTFHFRLFFAFRFSFFLLFRVFVVFFSFSVEPDRDGGKILAELRSETEGKSHAVCPCSIQRR